MSFLLEAKRQYIIKVGIANAILVWVMVRVVSRIFEMQYQPAYSVTLLTPRLDIGLPVVFTLTWVATGKWIADEEDSSYIGVDCATSNTSAFLPFLSISSEKDQEYLVGALFDEPHNNTFTNYPKEVIR